jgi:GcrA cell cycle regulator
MGEEAVQLVWNDERVETLKTLWAKGLTCAQIAMRLGGVTRNAVIGKVTRLGLPPRGRQNTRSPRIGGQSVPKLRALRRRTRERVPFNKVGPVARLKAEPFVPQAEPFVEPSNRKRLLELTDSSCRWPIGEVGEPDFGFCNREHVRGLPYCEAHARIAFRALNPTPPASEQPNPVAAPVRERVAA